MEKKGDKKKHDTGNERRGLIFVVSAPSGAGKTTLCKEVTPRIPSLLHSVSCTTRSPRNGEVNGKDYDFIDVATFQSMIDKNDFIEWAEVHGNLYGTPRGRLMQCVEQGIDVILDIDTQGAATIRKNAEGIYIFILPPSFSALSQRLVKRQSDPEEEIMRRLQKSREEIWNYRQYDYVIVNGEFEKALSELEAVILAERVRMKQINHVWIERTFIHSYNKEFEQLTKPKAGGSRGGKKGERS